MNGWPTFSLVYVPNELDDSVSEDVRMAAKDLTRQGVPEEVFGYQAAEAITHVVVNQKSLLRFGCAGPVSSMCMDVTTGSIVELAPDSRIWVVNSSLKEFIETTKVVIGRFPF